MQVQVYLLAAVCMAVVSFLSARAPRRLAFALATIVALCGTIRPSAQSVVVVPGTISGHISLAGLTINEATVSASPASGGPESTVTVSPAQPSADYSLTVSVPQSGSASFTSYAIISTDSSRDSLTTPTASIATSASAPGQLDFTVASVGFINASVEVTGGTLQSASIYANQPTASASTKGGPTNNLQFPTVPGDSIVVGGTAFLADGRSVPLTPQTVSVAEGQTLNVSFSVTAPSNAVSGTINVNGPVAPLAFNIGVSGPSSRAISQQPPSADHGFALDGLAPGTYSAFAYAYFDNFRQVLYLPDSAFSPSRSMTVGDADAAVDIAASEAFINSNLTTTGAPTLAPFLSSGTIQAVGQFPSAAAGGFASGQLDLASNSFALTATPGTYRLSALNLNYFRPEPFLSAGFTFYDYRDTSFTLSADTTIQKNVPLALGEVTIAVSIEGGTMSDPQIFAATCSSVDASGATRWYYNPYASAALSDVRQGQLTFAGPEGDCRVTLSMTVNGSNVVLPPINVTVVPGASQAIDVGGPSLTVTSPAAEAIVSDSVISIAGSASDDVAVAGVTVNGSAATLTSTNNPADAAEVSFVAPVTLQRGPNTITTVATDTSDPGKSKTDTRTVYFDTAAPTVSFTPADQASTDATSITIDGTADDDAGIQKVVVNGTEAAFTATGRTPNEVQYSVTLPLSAGENALTVVVTDISTRTTSVTHTVTRIIQRPTSLAVQGTGTYGGGYTLTATLVSGESPVAGAAVHFATPYGAFDSTTDANGVATVNGSFVQGLNAGAHTVDASFAGDASYLPSTAAGSLTIAKARPHVSVAAAGPFIYDAQPHATTASVRGVLGEDLGVVALSYDDVAGAPVGAGTHAAMGAFAGNDNYLAATGSGSIVIVRAPLTVTANSIRKTQGAANPVFTASYTGLAAGETPAVLGGTLTFATPATAASPTGTYPITPSGLTSSNYAIAFADGTLTITNAVCALFDQTKASRAGSTVPVKLRLCNATGANLSSPSTVVGATSLLKISNWASSDVQDSGDANPDADFRYDAALAGYIFNLKTTGLTTGTWQMLFKAAGDPVEHAIQFQIR